MTIAYSECVFVALDIQREMRMCRIILSSVPCPAVPYFPTFSHKMHDFRGQKFIERVLIVRL